MRRIRWVYRGSGLIQGILVLCVILRAVSPVAGQAPDEETFFQPPYYYAPPVESFRNVLRAPVRDSTNRIELDYRRNQLQQRLDGLKSVSDLRQALGLNEWRDEDVNDAIANIDFAVRQELANRLTKQLRWYLEHGGITGQLAAVDMLASMGTEVRGIGTRQGYARKFTPELAKLTRQGEPVVRAAAARALGQINADPQIAVPALESCFASPNIRLHRAAAVGLDSMMHIVAELSRSQANLRVAATRADVVQVGQAVVPAARRGLQSADGPTRRVCLLAIQEAANALADHVFDPSNVELPPTDRPLSEGERLQINLYRQGVEEERRELWPLAVALNHSAPAVAEALNDSSAAVRVAAANALADTGNAQQRLLRRAASVPQLPPEMEKPPPENKTDAGFRLPADIEMRLSARALQPQPLHQLPAPPLDVDPFRSGLTQAMPYLVAALADRDPQVRLAAVDALEMLREELTPAIPALVKALRDTNLFVRWAAARTLGKVRDVDVAAVVIGLSQLLFDPDIDVRLAAATTLERYGPRSAAAVPALMDMVNCGDPQSRIAMIRVLTAIGPRANAAIPAITQELTNADDQVRQAAAVSLGQFGPAAASAIEALRQALNDANAEVRAAAADSLLDILPDPQPRPRNGKMF
ncbi:MAG: HEAT repeat domain-containing protein [Gemmataceae bacterium]